MSDHARLDTCDDEELVMLIRTDRDRSKAEAELCARYRRRVYLYGVRYLRDATAAEDLAQDVLATVLERVRAGAIDEPARIGAFFHGVCRVMALSRRRGEARRARILASYVDPRAQPRDSDPTDLLEVSRVRDCLGRLSDRDRTVLLLSFYAELDADAVGRELGVAASHARVLRHRAFRRLRSCVDSAGGEP